MNAMRRTSTVLVAGIVAGMLLAQTAGGNRAVGALLFTDRAAWEAAIGTPITTDPFSTIIGAADTITFDTGVVSTRTGPIGNFVNSGGVFVARVLSTGDIRWTFETPILGLGFDYLSINSDTKLVGDFDGNGATSIAPNPTIGNFIGFFGLVGSVGFDTVTFKNSDSVDSFTVDDLSFGGIAPIPVPQALPLLLSGLLGLGLLARRRRDKAHHRKAKPMAATTIKIVTPQ